MELSTVQATKMALSTFASLSKDALHVHVALALFLAVLAFARNRHRLLIAWVCVLLAALIGEAFDMRDNLATLGRWRWRASLHDILNTMLWPTILAAVVRYTDLLRRQA